jgi:hypothetical protein
VHNICEIRRIEVHTAEPLAPGLSCLNVEIVIVMLKKYKWQGSDHISAELPVDRERWKSLVNAVMNLWIP